jgi:pimeloyl-ACP methyl ester carboxylesterase
VRVFGIIVGVIVAHVVGFLVNRTLLAGERDRVHPYGRLVDVDDPKMHVVALGGEDETIVLLAGANVPLPSADFGPLMWRLAERFTVVCIEYLGFGHSDTTRVPRTNENITREIRAALFQAGFAPPYVLTPHSASGI